MASMFALISTEAMYSSLGELPVDCIYYWQLVRVNATAMPFLASCLNVLTDGHACMGCSITWCSGPVRRCSVGFERSTFSCVSVWAHP